MDEVYFRRTPASGLLRRNIRRYEVWRADGAPDVLTLAALDTRLEARRFPADFWTAVRAADEAFGEGDTSWISSRSGRRVARPEDAVLDTWARALAADRRTSVAGAESLTEGLVIGLLVRSRGDVPTDSAAPARQAPAPPLTEEELRAVERELGFDLPSPLRAFYGVVANGGVGPGYGLIGLLDGVRSDMNQDVVAEYRMRRQPDPDDPGYFWPRGVLPVCHWGCAIYSCVDCRHPDGRVLRFDPNPVDDDWSAAWGLEAERLGDWLARWLAGDELFESGTPDGTFVLDR